MAAVNLTVDVGTRLVRDLPRVPFDTPLAPLRCLFHRLRTRWPQHVDPGLEQQQPFFPLGFVEESYELSRTGVEQVPNTDVFVVEHG
jgi:hypothetical protein